MKARFSYFSPTLKLFPIVTPHAQNPLKQNIFSQFRICVLSLLSVLLQLIPVEVVVWDEIISETQIIVDRLFFSVITTSPFPGCLCLLKRVNMRKLSFNYTYYWFLQE